MADQPPRTYLTHHNGDRPYKVVVTGDYVTVLEGNLFAAKPVYEETVNQIFVGSSPFNEMTWFSGGFGPEFDGNAMLLHEHDLEYVFVGQSVYRFHALSSIIKFVSPVGNNDVPYPYAIDYEDRYYLFIERVIVRIPPELITNVFTFDPYRYYYSESSITDIRKNIAPKFKGIKSFFNDGEEEWNLCFRADYRDDAAKLKNAYLVFDDDTVVTLTETSYNELMEEFAGMASIEILKYDLIHSQE